MTTLVAQKPQEHLQLMGNRAKILIAGRIRKRDKMQLAAQEIDKLRRKVENWDSVSEIRKLRTSR
jgi:uncharacterized protein YfeS